MERVSKTIKLFLGISALRSATEDDILGFLLSQIHKNISFLWCESAIFDFKQVGVLRVKPLASKRRKLILLQKVRS